MSGIAAVFSASGIDPGIAPAMLSRMPARGEPRAGAVQHLGDAVLGVCRHEWEMSSDFSGPVLVAREGELAVAADATLYFADDLRRRLASRGVVATGGTASHLILAAYRAWGPECARHLEGDFAFALWDGRRRRAVLARDFVGRRALYFATLDGSLAVASTVGGVLAHPYCPDDFNVACVASMAAGLVWSAGSDTCYRAVKVLGAGRTLTWTREAVSAPSSNWEAPARADDCASFEEGADALRHLMRDAVAERLAGSGCTTVWMSGGWDSTAVFGTGRDLVRDDAARALAPVSISYPEGDPGREDELIAAVADFWGTPVHWLGIQDIPLLDALQERALGSDEPPAHLYEEWNRALARGTRACGARVALDGSGGDQLFQVSDVYLADLLRNGSWMRLARELRAKRTRGARYLFRSAVQPALPDAVARLAARMRGSAASIHYMERPLPSWIRRDFSARNGLVERDRRYLPPRNARDRAHAENLCLITAPIWSWGASYMTGALLDEGIEGRSPLLDRRVVEFALARPVTERAAGRETKLLLRRAMRGLLPASVLEPRDHRTGVTVGYSNREMRRCYPPLFDTLFQSDLLLAQLGIVDPAELRRSVSDFRNDTESARVALFHTARTELWLRERVRRRSAPSPARAVPDLRAAFAS